MPARLKKLSRSRYAGRRIIGQKSWEVTVNWRSLGFVTDWKMGPGGSASNVEEAVTEQIYWAEKHGIGKLRLYQDGRCLARSRGLCYDIQSSLPPAGSLRDSWATTWACSWQCLVCWDLVSSVGLWTRIQGAQGRKWGPNGLLYCPNEIGRSLALVVLNENVDGSIAQTRQERQKKEQED